jgi:secreted PhoX family phosphatase
VRLWGDPVRGPDRFGFNADFTAFFPLGPEEGLLWVNHEFVNLRLAGFAGVWEQGYARVMGGVPDVEAMKQDLGGSVLHLARVAGRWRMVEGSRHSRRVTASPSRRPERLTLDGPAVADVFERHDVDGLGRAVAGTHSNCGGGQTPWGTALSCEENVQFWVPDEVDAAGRGTVGGRFGALGSKYGWVVEVDPYDPASVPVKHTALGRFRHEGVAVRARDGARVACYMGDDRGGGHVWKFLTRGRYRAAPADRAANRGLLAEGELHAARFHRDGTGRWIPIGPDTPLAPNGQPTQPIPAGATRLGQVYASPGAVLVDAFRAANAAGATPTGRPEDLEVDPVSGAVYVAFTGHVSEVDPIFATRLGELWRIDEEGDDAEATAFRWRRFVSSGGVPGQGGFAQPDNLMFDSARNLWMCTDISPRGLNNPDLPEGAYANNALFVVPTVGPAAGRPRQFASAPCEAELTGPSLTPDERTLFLSIQHPGERHGIRGVDGVAAPRGSNWPSTVAGTPPRPGVVAITPDP